MDVTVDWFWEGNVVEAIAQFLSEEGWTTKERGVDIQAARAGRTLLVEAKGYPARTYRDPRRAGEVKPTNPTNQAQQWYSHALLKVMAGLSQVVNAATGVTVVSALKDYWAPISTRGRPRVCPG